MLVKRRISLNLSPQSQFKPHQKYKILSANLASQKPRQYVSWRISRVRISNSTSETNTIYPKNLQKAKDLLRIMNQSEELRATMKENHTNLNILSLAISLQHKSSKAIITPITIVLITTMSLEMPIRLVPLRKKKTSHISISIRPMTTKLEIGLALLCLKIKPTDKESKISASGQCPRKGEPGLVTSVAILMKNTISMSWMDREKIATSIVECQEKALQLSIKKSTKMSASYWLENKAKLAKYPPNLSEASGMTLRREG